jgi:hypothetical protein
MAAGKATGSVLEAAEGPEAAFDRALALTPPDGLVVVTGSLYLVGKIREGLKGEIYPEAEALPA